MPVTKNKSFKRRVTQCARIFSFHYNWLWVLYFIELIPELLGKIEYSSSHKVLIHYQTQCC